MKMTMIMIGEYDDKYNIAMFVYIEYGAVQVFHIKYKFYMTSYGAYIRGAMGGL
jgi:hypothetical protein